MHPGLAGEVHPASSYVRRVRPDDVAILHYSIDSPAFAIARTHSRRLLMHYHNITPAELLWAHAPHVALECAVGRRRLAGYADLVAESCADSAFNARELSGLGFRDPVVTGILRRPLELPRPLPSRPPGPTRLLFVGRLTRQKGVDLLLHALALLPPAVALDVVGDGEERAALDALALSLGLASRVTWHGAQPGPALPDYYRAAVALVVTSVDEGLGLVAVEAQLCETPVVAFASGGLIDVVEHGVTGMLVEQRDPATLAAAIAAVIASADRGAALGRAGRERALSQFDPAVAARRYVDIYRAALDRTIR